MGLFVLIMSVCAVLASVSWSDEIVLTNGDRLTGKVEKRADDKLIFNSTLAEQTNSMGNDDETLQPENLSPSGSLGMMVWNYHDIS